MSGDPDKEYFSDGITEELINTFAQLEGLRVISRTSAFYFKKKESDLQMIREKLKVDTVLEGSVRLEGDTLRITAQLIKVIDDSHLWAGTYDRKLKNFCAIQQEVSQAIVDQLKPRLLSKEEKHLAMDCIENFEAYKRYLKGRYFWIKKTHKKAIEYFEQALALNPNYALAYSGLADVYNRMAFFFSASVEEYYLKAKAAVMKALEIDDTLSEAHAALGYLKVHFEWDWKGAEKALKKAIELNPGNVLAYRYSYSYFKALGRIDEAYAVLKKGLELDPLSAGINFRLGQLFYFNGEYDRAIEQFHQTIEMYPNHSPTIMFLGLSHVAKSKYEEGIELLQKSVRLTKGKSPLTLGFLGYSYGVAGKTEEAQEILDEVLERREEGYFSPFFIAVICTGLGDKDKAFEWLEKGYEERDPRQYAIKARKRLFRDLESDPRWTALLMRMGLEE
jgi:TolB-like protein/Tfp pilus assembly protein PilF